MLSALLCFWRDIYYDRLTGGSKNEEIIKQTVVFWENYWGDSLMMWLLWQQPCFYLIFRRKKKSTGLPASLSGSSSYRFLLSCYGKDHSEMYWGTGILARALAASDDSGNRSGAD